MRVTNCELILKTRVGYKWVGPLFCELYYTLTSCKLEFEWFLWQFAKSKLWVESWFPWVDSWVVRELKKLFDKFYELLKMQVTSNFTLCHFWELKLQYFHYSHNSTGHSQFQNIMRDKKSHKNRLRCNLLVFYTETCWTFCSQTTQWNVYIGRIGNYQMSWNLIFIVSTLFAVNFLGTYFCELTFWKMY